jgi:iron complex transport system substrate-binding protein
MTDSDTNNGEQPPGGNNNNARSATQEANDNDNKATKVVHRKRQEHCPALRIVSLLPSITEILAFIGVGEQIVGITHECDYPEWITNVNASSNTTAAKVVTTSAINPRTLTQSEIHEAVVGSLAQGNSLYGLNHDVLRAVQPDIIFTQSLCDVCAVSYPVVLDTCARILAGPIISTCGMNDDDDSPGNDSSSTNKKSYTEPQVISMEPNNLKDVLLTFHVAARALGPRTVERANIVVRDLELGFETIRQAVAKKVAGKNNGIDKKKKPTVAFMEWHCPIFSGGHWIPDMLDIAGGDYRMCQSGDRSSPWTDDDFARLDPDIILIGPCGFSLERAVQDTLALYHDQDTPRGAWWRQLRAVQTGRVYALDGNSYYARPGPRLLQGCGIMAKCIHDDDDDGSAEDDNENDFLSQELAPSSGYCRITPNTYETKNESL